MRQQQLQLLNLIMAASVKNVSLKSKLGKLERRALRKQHRKLLQFQKHSNEIELSDIPTRHLIVGNGGLLCGVERCHLLSWFCKYGSVDVISMIPEKPFSVVSFKNLEDSIQAYNKIHGQALAFPTEQSKTVTLYLGYLLLESADLLHGLPSVHKRRPILASDKEQHPPGLTVLEEFISREEEASMVAYFRTEDSDCKDSQSSLKHRRVKHYGYEFIYGENTINKDKPLHKKIPNICDSVIGKMIQNGIIKEKPDQLTVNEYEVGQGIPPHIDTHSAFTDEIISLSLNSQVVMDFSHPNGRQVSLMLPERSLLVMAGETRYIWTHGITPRKSDLVLEANDASDHNPGLTLKERGFRMSLTFRKIRQGACSCKYAEKCDSQSYGIEKSENKTNKNEILLPNSDTEARLLELEHVNNVYETIANHFSDTRHSPWPKVAKFLKDLPEGSLVADAGCGNGKYLAVNTDIMMFGSDRSNNLVKICRDRGNCAIVCDLLSLPYRSNAFDAVICIAVIHHLSTYERRLEAVRELARIVRQSGLILIYVWALEQNIDCDKIRKERGKSKESALQEKKQANATSTLDNCTDKGAISTTVESRNNDNADNQFSCITPRQSSTAGSFSELPRQTIGINETRNVFKQQDLLVPWHHRGSKETQYKPDFSTDGNSDENVSKSNEQVYHRFYHMFKENELESLCEQVQGVEIIQSYHDRGNWCVILRKSR